MTHNKPLFDNFSSEETMKKAFEYLKVHKKSLALSVVYLVLPVVAINALLYFFFIRNGLLNSIQFASTNDITSIAFSYLGIMAFSFISLVVLLSSVCLHIKISEEKGFYEIIAVQEVWERFKKEAGRLFVHYFVMALFNSFVIWIALLIVFLLVVGIAALFGSTGNFVMIVIGFILCAIAGIFMISYCLGVFGLNACMVVFEKENSIHLFGKALKIVSFSSKTFWQTVWTTIVALICMSLFYQVLYYPLYFALGFNDVTNLVTNYYNVLKIISIFSIIMMFITPFLSVIVFTLFSFLYFSLEENINHKTLYSEIESIGNNEEKGSLYDFS